MRYIVSGIHRSGTSMMMKCLIDGGITPIVSEYREMRMRANDSENYKLNPEGFYEVGQENYMRLGYTTELPDEICVKIQAIGLPILSADKEGYKIIFMRRDPEAIKRSYIKSFGQKGWDRDYGDKDWLEYYHHLTTGVIDIMNMRSDVDLLEIDYNSVVDEPFEEMRKIKDFGVPINVVKSALVPNKEYRRNEAA